MTDRVADLERRLAELAESHRRLEARITALERRPAPASARPGPFAAARRTDDVKAADVAGDLAAASKSLSSIGRTLLVLAGAFLLRAITDAGTIPTGAGIALGFAYAGAWIGMAYRAGASRPWDAGFHGLSAILIGFPLLVEATTRFRLLSPGAAAGTLTIFTTVALGVAVLRRLQALAWLIQVGGILAAVALMIATGRMAPAMLYLILLGVSALWLGYVLGWVYLRWPVAFFVDLGVVLMTLRAVSTAPAEGPGVALVLQVAATALYFGSIAVRTLLLNRAAVDFEVVQTAALLAVGLGGASYVTAQSGAGGAAVGLVSVLFSAAAYAVAFAFVEHRQRGKANFYFYSSVAIVFGLAGSGMLLSGGTLSLALTALAVVAAALARMLRRMTLAVHAAVYAVVAAIQCGALQHAATTLLASPSATWPATPGALAPVVLGMTAATWLAGGASAAPLSPQQRIPRCGLIAVLAVAAAGLVVGLVVPIAAGVPGPGSSAGVTATVRTAVLVVGALVLAWAGRLESWREAGWLAYPVLVITGFKLVLEDLARSRPSSLFLAFALYGTALILVPRLRRREAAARAPAKSAAA